MGRAAPNDRLRPPPALEKGPPSPPGASRSEWPRGRFEGPPFGPNAAASPELPRPLQGMLLPGGSGSCGAESNPPQRFLRFIAHERHHSAWGTLGRSFRQVTTGGGAASADDVGETARAGIIYKSRHNFTP
jgi:hypothetical protein